MTLPFHRWSAPVSLSVGTDATDPCFARRALMHKASLARMVCHAYPPFGVVNYACPGFWFHHSHRVQVVFEAGAFGDIPNYFYYVVWKYDDIVAEHESRPE
jgi:hypothetical protein